MARQDLHGGEDELRTDRFTVRTTGLHGELTTDGPPVDQLAPAPVAAALERSGLVPVGDPVRISGHVPVTRDSGDREPPTVRIAPARTRSTEASVQFGLVLEDSGVVRWALPVDGPGSDIAVPAEPVTPVDGGQRGLTGGLVGKVVQLVTAPLVEAVAGKVGSFFVRRWEAHNRPHRLRLVGRDLTALPDRGLTRGQAEQLLAGPALLLVHGTGSTTLGGFRGMADYLPELHRRYGGRVVAFDHPTLGWDPDENARQLTEEVHRLVGARGPLQVDVVAHSRGGLVARTLAERAGSRGILPDTIDVRSVTFVATPNAGTVLADEGRLAELLDTLTNVVGLVPGVPDALDAIMALVKQVAVGAHAGLDGLAAMRPDGAWLRELNRTTSATPVYRALTSDYEPPADAGLRRRLRDLVTDRVFGDTANDLVVPTDGVVAANGSSLFPIDRFLRIEPDADEAVDHSTFFAHQAAGARLRGWLEGGDDAVAPAGPAGVARPAGPVHVATRDELSSLSLDAVDEALAAGDVPRLRRVVRSLDEDALQQLSREAGIGWNGVVDVVRAGTATRSQDTVVVVPGLLGSNLDVTEDGRARRVWLHPWRLVTGAFQQLALDPEAARVSPGGVHRVHVPLLLALDLAHHVVPFDYDWRRGPAVAGAALAERLREVRSGRRPGRIHVVAHSMGGLVARHALAGLEDDVLAGGRLVQLGTPNHGSYAIPLVLRAEERLVTWLAAADLRSSTEDIVRVLRGFPGILELLPSPVAPTDRGEHGDPAELYEPGPLVGGATDDEALGAALAAAAAAHRARAADAPVPPGSAMVLGTGHWTVLGHRVEDGEVRFGRTRRGDGRVPHLLARVEEVADADTWYVEADHAAMLVDPRVLASLPELLAGDTPTLLSATDPVALRGEVDTPPLLRGQDLSPPVPTVRGERGRGEVVDRATLAVGAAQDWLGTAAAPTTRSLRVEVVHGLVQGESGPWLLGHVSGTPLSGSERAIDGLLDGRLQTHVQVGEYPSRAGEPLVVRGPAGHGQHGEAPEVLVVGLGQWGELAEPELVEGVTRAVLLYLAAATGRTATRLTTVLVGSSGDAGLPIHAVVAAIVRGVLAANRRAAAIGEGDAPFVDHLRITEMYEDLAHAAARAVREVRRELDPSLLQDVDLELAAHIRPGHDGVPGSPPVTERGGSWRRLVIRVVDEHGGPAADGGAPDGSGTGTPRLDMRLLGRWAAAPTTANSLLPDVRRLVGQPGSTPRPRPEWLSMLWHMLVPPALRHGLDGHLQLALDPAAAALPWEMLATRDHLDRVRALSLRHGMLRQLLDEGADTRIMGADRSGSEGEALVIGDPPTHAPRLPGARAEAHAVVDALARHGLTVDARIYEADDTGDRSGEILEALFSRPWEVVHIAAHGLHVPSDPERSGVVIGRGHLLRGEHLASLSTTPRLVVLNCCHLGRLDTADGDVARTAVDGSPPGFAAGVARSLMRHGVPAVVAAGWAVDDVPAKQFAVTLYEELLGDHGADYGDAVRRARLATFRSDEASATWGAYQCYGDAAFRLRPSRAGTSRLRRPTGPSELVAELDHLRRGSTVRTSPADLAAQLDRLLDSVPRAWQDLPRVAEAVGVACAARGAFDDAVRWYELAVRHPSADVGLRTLEQLANLRTRVRTFDGAALKQVERELERLQEIQGTTERHGMLGAAYKRYAASLSSASSRRANVRKALDHYLAGATSGHDRRYPATNIAHLAAVLGTDDDEHRRRLADAAASSGPGDFWAAAARGDLVLYDRILGRADDAAVTGAYLGALRAGPSHQEWASVHQQCRTLGHLLGDAALVDVADRLAAAADALSRPPGGEVGDDAGVRLRTGA